MKILICKLPRFLFLLSFTVLLCGCRNQAEPVDNSGFLPNAELMGKNDLVPVHRIWQNADMKSADYKKIMVMPVCTEWQMQNSSLEKKNIRSMLNQDQQDIEDLALYTQNAFRKAIKEDPDKRFELATQAGEKTLLLKIAFVKVVPGKPVLGTLKNVSNLTPVGAALIPLKMGVMGYADTAMQSSMAIEASLTDSQTGRNFIMFADRKKQKTAIFNANDFTAYGNLRQLVDIWSKDFLTLLKKQPLETGEKMEDENSGITIINY